MILARVTVEVRKKTLRLLLLKAVKVEGKRGKKKEKSIFDAIN